MTESRHVDVADSATEELRNPMLNNYSEGMGVVGQSRPAKVPEWVDAMLEAKQNGIGPAEASRMMGDPKIEDRHVAYQSRNPWYRAEYERCGRVWAATLTSRIKAVRDTAFELAVTGTLKQTFDKDGNVVSEWTERDTATLRKLLDMTPELRPSPAPNVQITNNTVNGDVAIATRLANAPRTLLEASQSAAHSLVDAIEAEEGAEGVWEPKTAPIEPEDAH